jgi:hypothetical protein
MNTEKDLKKQIHTLQRWSRFQSKLRRFVWVQYCFVLLYTIYHDLLAFLSYQKVISSVDAASWSPQWLFQVIFFGSLLFCGLSQLMMFPLTEYFASKVKTLSASVAPAQWTIPIIRAHLLTFSVGDPSSLGFESRLHDFENSVRRLTELISEDRLDGMTSVEWKWLLDTFFCYGYAEDDRTIASLQQALLEAIARHRVLHAKPVLRRLLKQSASTPEHEVFHERVAACLQFLEQENTTQDLLRASEAPAQREHLLRSSKPDTDGNNLLIGVEGAGKEGGLGHVESSRITESHGSGTGE